MSDQNTAKLMGLAVQLHYASAAADVGEEDIETHMQRWSPMRALALFEERSEEAQKMWLAHARKVSAFAGVTLDKENNNVG